MNVLNAAAYRLKDPDAVDSPSLIYYEDIIRHNLKEMLRIAGGPKRLWPHVKTHKTAELIQMQLDLGIRRFKCATIAEAEMLARCSVEDILLAYPLVGPAISRFARLRKAYPASRFWAVGDDLSKLRELGIAAGAEAPVPLLIDIDAGMHRTGVPLDRLEAFAVACAGIPGIALRGFHAYDGSNTAPDLAARMAEARRWLDEFQKVRIALNTRGITDMIAVVGGTPSFPCHAACHNDYLSPGTAVVYDYGYHEKYTDLNFMPGAAILGRVISRPGANLFTVDVGYKAISADPAGVRGVIIGMDVEPLSHSEEHWVFRTRTGAVPPVGEHVYILPTHICPTTALYGRILLSNNGEITGEWPVTARERRLTI